MSQSLSLSQDISDLPTQTDFADFQEFLSPLRSPMKKKTSANTLSPGMSAYSSFSTIIKNLPSNLQVTSQMFYARKLPSIGFFIFTLLNNIQVLRLFLHYMETQERRAKL